MNGYKMRRTFAIAAVAFLSIAGVSCKPPVYFVSPCNCRDTRDKGRWDAKTDPSLPPTDASAIQSVKPSDILAWAAPTERLTRNSKRIPAEERWCTLTGRVIDLRVEPDGDIHIALQDATADKQGIVVVEVPEGPPWCDIRKTVFSWTEMQFPFQIRTAQTLKMIDSPIITVTGKAFFDISDLPRDRSNRRTGLPGYAAWEIHPVMKLSVQALAVAPS
jgi:hypothetical protein